MSTPTILGALLVSHSGQFPAVTLTFNLPPGVALGQAVAAIQQASDEIGMPSSLITSFQGNAQAFQAALANEPILIAAALVVVYVILGVLYESYIHHADHSLDAAFGRRWRAAGVVGRRLRPVGHRHHRLILLIGIVKKNGIMLVDFAINRERAGLSPREAVRPGLSAAVSSDHDDDHDGIAQRRAADAGPWLGNRNCVSRSAMPWSAGSRSVRC